MKKILHIVLISLIVFNSAGYVFTYWQLKVIFKQTALKKIEQSLPDEQLQLIEASLDGMPVDSKNCIRVNKKEFRLNNEMYDIVRYEIKDTLIHYYCLKDENENLLEAAFITYVEGNPNYPAGTLPVKNLMKILSADWENPEPAASFFNRPEKFLLSDRGEKQSFHKSIPVPPPRFISC